MEHNRKVIETKQREVKTYAEMWRTSDCLLQKGLGNPEGSFHQFMASLVFTAFTLEAYLNHIGPKVFKCWDDLERLGPKEKLNVISEQLGVNIDYGKRPWQVMQQLFGFRNDIAHGKSIVVKTCDSIPLHKHCDEQFGQLVRTKWEKYCTQNNAVRAREDVEEIVNLLYEAGSFENDFPFTSGMQLRSATVIDE
ncbi:MAG: hypothetical protein KQH63_21380 [Desulfobulbaceae bacterium]|nr:hypothetical protein [Desulfobulbaceae bacterium]